MVLILDSFTSLGAVRCGAEPYFSPRRKFDCEKVSLKKIWRMVRVCLFQCGGSGTPIENVGMLLSALESAERSGAQIVLFPELFIHGYCIGPQFAELAEPRDGPIFQAVSVAAQKHNVCVVYGYAESATEDASEIRRIFNSVQVVDKNGISVINYRKTHLWGEYEKLHFFPGKCLPPVVEIEGFKLSVLICYDIEFPEPARILAAKGAQLILVPTACTIRPPPHFPPFEIGLIPSNFFQKNYRCKVLLLMRIWWSLCGRWKIICLWPIAIGIFPPQNTFFFVQIFNFLPDTVWLLFFSLILYAMFMNKVTKNSFF